MTTMLGRIVAATGILDRLRAAWKQDLRTRVDPLRDDLARLRRQVEVLEARVEEGTQRAARAEAETARIERDAAQLRLTLRLDEQHEDAIKALPSLLDAPRLVEHVRGAISSTPLQMEPYPHLVVENVLPPDVYRLLLRAIPPAAFFTDRDPIKQNLRIPLKFGPVLTRRVWDFFDVVIAREAIRPAVMEVFREPLRLHTDTLFGAAYRERVDALPQAITGGRVMLRRPGYFLGPHRDPKRSMLTCLMYLAKPEDSPVYGTEIYRVIDDGESSYSQTYYPEEEGRRCELVKVVPYRANSMLVFLNSFGAHGARIPQDAPADTQRHAYQFYIGPEPEALDALIKDLPPDRQALWRPKPS
jgi:hypothetical protein